VRPDLSDDLRAVSRETRERLDVYVRELTRWQRALNLVANSTMADLWTRHIADSLQLISREPDAGSWLDLGSGAGLPGLVIAAETTRRVTLVESDSRKCAFIRSAAHAMGVSVEIRNGRIETVLPTLPGPFDVVTARGLAPLDKLLAYARPQLSSGAIGLFPKGRGYQAELTAAQLCWTFTADILDSRTDSGGRILRIRNFEGPRV
jgi:16S rRNA (guanine527-N7)-methyltransferase